MGKYPVDQFIHNAIQDIGGIAGLTVTVRLLSGLSIADVSNPFDPPVWVLLAGIKLPIGSQRKSRSAVAAEHISGEEGGSTCVKGDGAGLFGGIGAGGTNALGRLELLLGNDLQMRQHLRPAL